MLKFEEICELIRLVGSTKVTSVEIEHAGSRVHVQAEPVQVVAMAAQPTVHAAVPATATTAFEVAAAPGAVAAGAESAGGEAREEDLHVVSSPIVGTFYRAPNPDADPYVRVGDFVEKGQVLCIVEAMKLMNEIECDASGTIVKVYRENAQPVEYGQPLFALRIG